MINNTPNKNRTQISDSLELEPRFRLRFHQQNPKGILLAQALLTCLSCLFLLGLSPRAFAQDLSEDVRIQADGSSYKLQVEGKDYQIKGVVWDYSPIGENFNYNLWDEPENFIRKVLDRDGELMSAMGVNTIRSFSMIPPKWVTYLYLRWNIRSIINPLFGRYGVSARGKWNAPTDYSDQYQRDVILEETLKVVETYKDTPGLLLFLFGNENNYGLSWTSNEIEDLPVGEQNITKAAYLYTLFEEAIRRAKEIDSRHPIGFINGDTQYASLIKDIVVSADLVGLNSYRGASFGNLFAQVQEMGLPFVFTEIGADAYNVLSKQEDQAAQQYYIINQWREIYQNAGSKGVGNALGGFVFSWTDGWWKHDQGDYEKAAIHDTIGTWSNGAYLLDFDSGKNNMNEEWFGIAGLQPSSLLKGDFLNRIETLELRSTYYGLQKLWSMDLYEAAVEDVDAMVKEILPNEAMRIAEKGKMNFMQMVESGRLLSVDHLSVSAVGSGALEAQSEFADKTKTVLEQNVDNIEYHHGLVADATIASRVFDNLYVAARLRVMGNYLEPYFLDPSADRYGANLLQLYQAEVLYDGKYFDVDGYFRNGHKDWAAEGDFFYMLPESFDINDLDKGDSMAPFGVQFTGNRFLQGLKIYGGPEIFKGAKPQVMAKYLRNFNFGFANMGFAVMLNQEISYIDEDKSTRTTLNEPTTKASLYNYWSFGPYFRIDYGLYFGGHHLLEEDFLYSSPASSGAGSFGTSTNLKIGSIGILDTLALKARLSTEILRYTKIYAQGILAGPAADSNGAIPRDGFIRSDSGKGNRIELELGGMFQYGNFGAGLKGRYRRNIFKPLPIGYFASRDVNSSPFVVTTGNRELIEAEALLSFDPTGATYLHNFDMDDNENALIAGSLAFLWTFYAGATDPAEYTAANGSKQIFPTGLAEQTNLWTGLAKVVFNPPNTGLHLVGKFGLGHEGSSAGENTELKTYFTAGIDGWWGPMIFKTSFRYNYWGPESYYREFNLTYPSQWSVDVGLALDGKPSLLNEISKVGLKVEGRYYDPNSAAAATEPDMLIEIQAYVTLVLAKSHKPKLGSR